MEIILSLVGRAYNTRGPAIESHREHCYFFGDNIYSTVTLAKLNNLQWSEQETWSVYMCHQGMMTLVWGCNGHSPLSKEPLYVHIYLH